VRETSERRLKESRREQSRCNVQFNIRLMKLKVASITGWPQDLKDSMWLDWQISTNETELRSGDSNPEGRHISTARGQKTKTR